MVNSKWYNIDTKINMGELKKLKYLIDVSLANNSMGKLDTYLSSLKNSKEFLNADCILILKEVLKRSGKHEEKSLHVYCVLTCLNHFLNTVSDTQIWKNVAEDLSTLCKIMFNLSCSFIRDYSVVQKVVNVISALTENMEKIADNLLKFTFQTMLESCLSRKLSKHTRLLIMNLIGTVLQNSSREIRSDILPSTIDLLNKLSNFLAESDDYETQVSVVEILARAAIFIDTKHESFFTKNEKIAKIFKKCMPFLNFDPDCRLFLNEVNGVLGEQQKVFPLPCMMIFADNNQLRKPIDPTYSDFWVDFNLGSRSLSFYYQQANSEFWELMTLPRDRVISAVAKESACQSRSGEKFEAVKLELTMDSSPESEIPREVRIYPRRDRFIKIESVVQTIFDVKYESKVTCSKTVTGKIIENQFSESTHTSNSRGEVTTFFETSIPQEIPENENEEGVKDSDKTKGSSLFSDLEIAEGSPHSTYMKKRMPDQITSSDGNGTKENQCILPINFPKKEQSCLEKGVMSNSIQLRSNSQVDKQDRGKNKSGDVCNTKSKAKNHLDEKVQGNKLPDSESGRTNKNFFSVGGRIKKSYSQSKKGNISVLNANSKKKCLYSLEKSNTDDVVMSSQDQVLSVEIPSYKFTKKESFINSKPNVNRKNISYSYIANKNQQISTTKTTPIKTDKPFNFEVPEESDKLPYNHDDSESDSKLSQNIFKDTQPKPLAEGGKKQNIFFKRSEKDSDKISTIGSPKTKMNFRLKSIYSDFSSPERRKELKCSNTYGRKKPKPCKRNRIMQIESSDSDSQLVSPSKVIKKGNEENEELSQKNSQFVESVKRKKIDPIRDNVLPNEMKLDRDYDYEEQEIKPREVVVKSLMKQGKSKKSIPRILQARTGRGKNAVAGKKKTKQVDPIQTINSNFKKCGPKIAKEDILEKISESITDCVNLVQHDVPGLGSKLACEDLTLDIPNFNDDQQKALLLNTTFKVCDLLKFGKILMKQIQDKMQHAEKLANKEREMNLSAFDYKIQASCSELYGSCQNMESLTDKLEKLNAMFQVTYKLHKEITTQVNLQAMKIEEAKNDMIINIKTINKSESRSLSSIFRGLGGYLKRIALSFIQGNTNKSAITN